MSLETFLKRTGAYRQPQPEPDPFGPPAAPAPPRRRPRPIAEQLAADLRELSAPGNATWAAWPAASRATWARSVLAVASIFNVSIPPDVAPWVAFWARK